MKIRIPEGKWCETEVEECKFFFDGSCLLFDGEIEIEKSTELLLKLPQCLKEFGNGGKFKLVRKEGK